MTLSEKEKVHEGLEDVVALNTSISEAGTGQHLLRYRGYNIDDLAAHASFEEVSWLLIRGDLPNKSELEGYRNKLRGYQDLPALLKKTLEQLPPQANMMEILNAGCAILGILEPEKSEQEQITIADRLIACFPSIIMYWWNFHHDKYVDLFTKEDTHAAHILHLILKKKPEPEFVHCFNAAMILYAEHELNASTFAVRTIASTLTDFYSSICGGICALKGVLHGGLHEESFNLIKRFNNPDEVEKGIRHMLGKHPHLIGFGNHLTKKAMDPRCEIMKKWAHTLSLHSQEPHLFEIAKHIEEVVWEEKREYPTLDFYSGLALHYMGIPVQMFTPIFAFARVSGWSAHLIEQRENNRLIRPLSRYIGPGAKRWEPIDVR